jgi:hypothetical protein
MPDVVTGALQTDNVVEPNFDEDAIGAFGRSGFGYCDAKLIGAYFNESPWDG